MRDQTIDRIRQEISANRVVLFMKGTAESPYCGFSAAVVAALERLGVPFRAIDVLPEPELRQALKTYSDWPTIPQLYVDGAFIGGCDIVTEMHQTGELESLLRGERAGEGVIQF
jgi:monothiol glutaredoxin